MGTYAVKLQRSTPLSLERHPDAAPESDFAGWCAREKEQGRPLAIDLFSGAGGLGLGVEAAGWTIVAAADRDAYAVETHAANFRGKAVQVDMSDDDQVRSLIDSVRDVGIDLVVGGPPCQPFSRAGMAKIRSLVRTAGRSPIDARKELWQSFVKVVVDLKPRAVIMENVPDMAIGDDLAVVRTIADILEHAGYIVDYRLLDAWKYGVPQHRKRFILQARLDQAPIWPSRLEGRPSVRDAIGDLPDLNGSIGDRELPYDGQPMTDLARQLRDHSSTVIHDHMTRPVREDDYEAFSLMNSSTLYSDLPEHLRRYRSDTFTDKYKRLDWDDLSRTITAHIAKDGYWYIHPSEHRTLTVREAARLQTFPDSFRFAGTRSEAFRQIGNAVPPQLGRLVAECAQLADPNDTEGRDHPSIAQIRSAVENFGESKRDSEWWLFPGSKMTPLAALIASSLDVHRLQHDLASRIMAPVAALHNLSIADLNGWDESVSKGARKHIVRSLRREIRDNNLAGWFADTLETLSAGRRDRYAMLSGQTPLILNEHVARVVSNLMRLNEDQRGLRTDVKVALAQIVSKGPKSGLRMASILVLPEALSRVSLRSWGNHSQVAEDQVPEEAA